MQLGLGLRASAGGAAALPEGYAYVVFNGDYVTFENALLVCRA
jgi:hypothetical protein